MVGIIVSLFVLSLAVMPVRLAYYAGYPWDSAKKYGYLIFTFIGLPLSIYNLGLGYSLAISFFVYLFIDLYLNDSNRSPIHPDQDTEGLWID